MVVMWTIKHQTTITHNMNSCLTINKTRLISIVSKPIKVVIVVIVIVVVVFVKVKLGLKIF